MVRRSFNWDRQLGLREWRKSWIRLFYTTVYLFIKVTAILLIRIFNDASSCMQSAIPFDRILTMHPNGYRSRDRWGGANSSPYSSITLNNYTEMRQKNTTGFWVRFLSEMGYFHWIEKLATLLLVRYLPREICLVSVVIWDLDLDLELCKTRSIGRGVLPTRKPKRAGCGLASSRRVYWQSLSSYILWYGKYVHHSCLFTCTFNDDHI